MKIVEDGVWRYYNCPDPHWRAKCRACREKVASCRAPVEECLNCWKIEIWQHGKALLASTLTFDELMDRMEITFASQEGSELIGDARSLEDARISQMVAKKSNSQTFPDLLSRDPVSHVVAKASRAPIQVVRSGIPKEGYPQSATDCLLMLYSDSIATRDRLRDAAQRMLGGGTAGECPSIPIRRGCWRYDDILGPWETWYPAERDFVSESSEDR